MVGNNPEGNAFPVITCYILFARYFTNSTNGFAKNIRIIIALFVL